MKDGFYIDVFFTMKLEFQVEQTLRQSKDISNKNQQEDGMNKNVGISIAKEMNFALCPDDIVQADFLMDDVFIKFKTESIKNNFKRVFSPYQRVINGE
uniref:Uncharacterized protein n=1 Tax=Glossina palpalis gambiensis TaxID=67801 RepID=A0A1B0BAW9_9MUSC